MMVRRSSSRSRRQRHWAVRTAEAAQITLAAIARDDGFELFTHPQRVDMPLASMSPDKLVYMANQIGKFFAHQGQEKAIAGIADHLGKFWICGCGKPSSHTSRGAAVKSTRSF